MGPNFVNVDHDTPLLLPPDLRDWLTPDHLARFILETLRQFPMDGAVVNQKGCGSEQYPPRMMVSLLIYGFITKRFSSRAIERATYDDVAMRFLSAGTHPDHHTICKFRRENKGLIDDLFLKLLLMASELGLLKVGTVAVDGTKVKANASKHKAMSHKRLVEQINVMKGEIASLMKKAEEADSTPLEDGLTIPEEIARRESRVAKLSEARLEIERRLKIKAELDAQETAKSKPNDRSDKDDGAPPAGGSGEPKSDIVPTGKEQMNFTDPESRIMPTQGGKVFEQAFNAQAVVDASGSRLILGNYVTDHTNDKKELIPALESIPAEIGKPESVAVDTGYFSEEAVKQAESDDLGAPSGIMVYAAVERKHHGRTVKDLEIHQEPPPPAPDATMTEVMRHRLSTAKGRAVYKLRKETVEPVFGIIKEAMGFRRFLMRGLKKVNLEWKWVSLAYNFKRMHVMVRAIEAGNRG